MVSDKRIGFTNAIPVGDVAASLQVNVAVGFT